MDAKRKAQMEAAWEKPVLVSATCRAAWIRYGTYIKGYAGSEVTEERETTDDRR